MVFRGDLVHGELGQRIGGVATGQPDFDRAEVLEIARHRGLGGLDAVVGQQGHQLPLAGDGLGLEQLGDPVLALVLGHPGGPGAGTHDRALMTGSS